MTSDWIRIKLKDIADITMGQSPKSIYYNTEGEGLPFFQGCGEFGELYPVVQKYCSDPKRIAKKNDILMSVRAPIGDLNIADRLCCIGRGLCSIRAKKNGRFVYYLLKANRDKIESYGSGTTYQAINKTEVNNLPFVVPPFPLRVKINSILSAYDDLIENNTLRIRILEEMAQRIYREWFIHFRYPGHENQRFVDSELGKIPEEWKVYKTENVMGVIGGGTPSTKKEEYWNEGDINWYVPKDLTQSVSMFSLESTKKITKKGLAKSSAQLFPKFSVMLTSRATIGAISINVTDACTNQGFITCVPSEKLSTFFIYFWLKENVEFFKTISSGATFKELTKTTFKKIDILVPKSEIICAFSELIGQIGHEILILIKKQKILRLSRDLLLPKLISGKIDVSDLDIDVGIEA